MREDPFAKAEYEVPVVSQEGRWMRHEKLGDMFVLDVSYASFWMNGWRPIDLDEVERLSELQRLAAANAASNIQNGGVVERTSTGDNVSERRDTYAGQPPLSGVSLGLQDKGCAVGQAKITRRRKGSTRKTV